MNIDGRRIMLSDIIASNTTIDGYMKVILSAGKERHKFYMDREVNLDNIMISTSSNIK